MNPAKYTALDYINFLFGTQKAYSCVEAARVQPERKNAPAHNAITRLLHRLEPSSAQLWTEAQALVNLAQGMLVVDNSTLDKLYS